MTDCPCCGHPLEPEPPTISLDDRDGLLRVIMALAPGESDRAQILFTLDCLAGEALHPDPIARQYLRELREGHAVIPGYRQLFRILHGQRSDGWRVT